jgi:hypothetical protein
MRRRTTGALLSLYFHHILHIVSNFTPPPSKSVVSVGVKGETLSRSRVRSGESLSSTEFGLSPREGKAGVSPGGRVSELKVINCVSQSQFIHDEIGCAHQIDRKAQAQCQGTVTEGFVW